MYEEWFEKLCEELRINRIKQYKDHIEITLNNNLTNNLNGDLLFMMVSNITRSFRFKMQNKSLIITLELKNLEKHFIYYLIELLEIIKKSVF